jgi:hypothetical protein
MVQRSDERVIIMKDGLGRAVFGFKFYEVGNGMGWDGGIRGRSWSFSLQVSDVFLMIFSGLGLDLDFILGLGEFGWSE